MLDVRNRAEARKYKEEQKALGNDVDNVEIGDVDWLNGPKKQVEEIEEKEEIEQETAKDEVRNQQSIFFTVLF